MKSFLSCFVTEFRHARPLLPWLLGSHAFMIAIRTRWEGRVSDQLSTLVEWSAWMLALVVVVIGLWSDAPLRRDRFLATRPQRFVPLAGAKFLALLLMAVVPFAVGDFITLSIWGIHGTHLWMGTIRTLLMFLVALCALFPAVWWWRDRLTGFASLGITFVSLVACAHLLSRLPGNRNPYGGETFGFPFGVPLVLTFLGALAVLAAGFLPLFAKRRDSIRIPFFAGLACLSLWIGLKVFVRGPDAAESRKPAIVSASLYEPHHRDAGYRWFSASVPTMPGEPDNDVIWSFSRLRINGRDVRPWARRSNRIKPESHQIRSALARRFGPVFLDPRANDPYRFSPRGIVPDQADGNGKHDIDFELVETHFRWEVAVDMPLKEGASVSGPDGVWAVRAMRRSPGWRGGEGFEVVNRHVESGKPDGHRPGGHRYPGDDIACVVDTETGTAISIGLRLGPALAGSAKTRICQIDPWQFNPFDEPGKRTIDFSRSPRFVVLRPTVAREIAHAWKSPAPISLPWSFTTLSTQPAKEELRGIDPIDWITTNPPPEADAPQAEAEIWLAAFKERLEANHDQVSDRERLAKLRAALSPFVTRHPGVMLRGMTGHDRARWMIEPVIRAHLPRDLPRRFPEFALHPVLVRVFIGKGWAADLAAVARDKARSGQPAMAAAVLTAVPREIGLSGEEWLDFFRLNPNAEVYEALADTVIGRERIDAEVDAMLTAFRVRPGHSITPWIRLALARGRPEAPRWLREDLEEREEFSRFHHINPERYFRFPEFGKHPNPAAERKMALGWFLSVDPERFVFDPATRRYSVPSAR